MLAYSSINHAGFILVGVEAATDRGLAAALFYLLAYTFMVVGSFGVVTLVGRRGDSHHTLDDYRGLSSERPALALAFAIFLLAQAGVPFTSGFLAKFYVIGAAIDAESYGLAIVGMLSAVISVFLYLRIVVAMYMTGEAGEVVAPTRRRLAIPVGAGVSLGLALAFTVVVGLLPSGVIDLARDAIPSITSAGP
jgi:NADH-quinone oxidoreductase subunit N